MITTKFLGATNFRDKRVRATFHTGDLTIVVPWNHELDTGENHLAAAKKLAEDNNLAGEWQRAGSTDTGCVFTRRRTVVFTVKDARA